jgi:hypothetical protein
MTVVTADRPPSPVPPPSLCGVRAATDPTIRWERSPGVLWRWLRGAVLLVDDDEGYHRIDGAASVLWALLFDPVDLPTLAAEVAADLGLDRDTALATLGDALEALAAQGFVRAHDGTAP